jgi:hypothetical protein
LPAAQFIPLPHKGHDAPRNHSGDEAHPDLFAGRLGGGEFDEHVFILERGLGLERADKLARRMPQARYFAADGRVLHMNVDHGQENRNAVARPWEARRLVEDFDGIDFAVARGEGQARSAGGPGFGISKEINGEAREEQPKRSRSTGQPGQPGRPAEHEAQQAGGNHRQQGREDQLERRPPGYPRVFHCGKLKLQSTQSSNPILGPRMNSSPRAAFYGEQGCISLPRAASRN